MTNKGMAVVEGSKVPRRYYRSRSMECIMKKYSLDASDIPWFCAGGLSSLDCLWTLQLGNMNTCQISDLSNRLLSYFFLPRLAGGARRSSQTDWPAGRFSSHHIRKYAWQNASTSAQATFTKINLSTLHPRVPSPHRVSSPLPNT